MNGDNDQEPDGNERKSADYSPESLFPESHEEPAEEVDFDFLTASESPQDLFPAEPNNADKLSPLPPQSAPPPPLPPRPSRRSPSNYYHPNDYYLGTDWPRVIVGGLISLLILGGVVLLAVYLFEKFDAQNEPTIVIPSQTEEEILSVMVYACAGDSIPVNEIEPPSQAFLEGKNAAGTWIAFRDPSSPLIQLWARADELPTLDFGSLAILSCENPESDQNDGSPLSVEGNG